MSHKTLDNDLVVICKSKVTLTFNKSAYFGFGQNANVQIPL